MAYVAENKGWLDIPLMEDFNPYRLIHTVE